MANSKQQEKRVRLAARQRLENLRYRTQIKTLFRRLRDAADSGESEPIADAHRRLVVLLVGSVASARRRRDPRPLLVAAGVAVVALASTATRLDVYALFALGQAAGIVLILLGLVWRRATPRS